MPVLAVRFGNELYGWSMAFLRKLATCAREWVLAKWLASGIPEAHGIGYELRGWLMTFLRKLAICAGE